MPSARTCTLLGGRRADEGSIRAISAIQNRIALDADEEKAVEVRREMIAGQERVWTLARLLATKEFEFTDPEVARIKPRSRRGTRMSSTSTAVGCNAATNIADSVPDRPTVASRLVRLCYSLHENSPSLETRGSAGGA